MYDRKPPTEQAPAQRRDDTRAAERARSRSLWEDSAHTLPRPANLSNSEFVGGGAFRA